MWQKSLHIPALITGHSVLTLLADMQNKYLGAVRSFTCVKFPAVNRFFLAQTVTPAESGGDSDNSAARACMHEHRTCVCVCVQITHAQNTRTTARPEAFIHLFARESNSDGGGGDDDDYSKKDFHSLESSQGKNGLSPPSSLHPSIFPDDFCIEQ